MLGVSVVKGRREKRKGKIARRGGGHPFSLHPSPLPPIKITSLLTPQEALILSFKQPYLVKNCQSFET